MNRSRIWRKRLLTTQYGHDHLTPMSPSTLKVERHDPGGLVWWEDLTEIGINIVGFGATVTVASLIDPVFGTIWTLLCMLAVTFFAETLRFRLFRRRPSTVTTLYVPASIPSELIERYERASLDLRQAISDLEAIAASQGIEPCSALRSYVDQKD